MNLRERAGLVDTVGSALSRGEHTLTVLPGLIRQLLEEGAWKEFETKRGEHITYTRFEDFVMKPPLAGLGATVDLVKRIVQDDEATLLLLDEALRKPRGNPTGANQHQRGNSNNVTVSSPMQRGNSKAYALQKLSDEGEIELLDQVKAGELSSHAAMVKAGFRKRIYHVNLDNPKLAATLIERASPAFLEELKRLLSR